MVSLDAEEAIKFSICIGCGLEIDPITGLLEVQLRPGGGISCDNSGDADDGLFVTFPPPPEAAINVTNAPDQCVDLSGNGTAVSPLHAALDISEDACNGVQCRVNGLYAPIPDSLVGTGNFAGEGASFPLAITGINNTYNILSDCETQAGAVCVAGGGGTQVQFTNPTCCTVEGFWEFIAYGGVITGASADFDATGFLTTSVNNSAYAETPLTNMKYYGDADKTVFELGGYQAKNYIILGPGASFAVSAQFTMFVATGSATWSIGPNFEVYVHLTQTGC